jgi:TonB family protein
MRQQRLFPRIRTSRPVQATTPRTSRPSCVSTRVPVPPKLDQLVLSNPKKQSRTGISKTLVSASIHAALIYTAVIATMDAAATTEQVVTDTSLVFLAVERDDPREPETNETPPPTVTVTAPPQGFQTVIAPVDIPVAIPAVDLGQRFDPRDYSGKGGEGGVFAGIEGGTAPVEGQVFRAEVVDETPEWLGGPPLEYPPALRQAGVTGHVVLEFVIDTTGRVDSTTLRVLETTHDAFTAPARATILGGRFRPGRVRGIKVRVLAEQRLDFRIARAQGRDH